MEHKVYRTESITVFYHHFLSEGPQGPILKCIKFSPIPRNDNMFNLSLHDIDSSGYLSDTVISNNADHKTIFATIAITTIDFLERFPDKCVVFLGNTPARLRLYRMTISNNLNDISKYFDVFGLINGSWKPFELGNHYQAFLVEKKNN